VWPSATDKTAVRAATDGSAFMWWQCGTSPQGLNLWVRDGAEKVSHFSDNVSPGFVAGLSAAGPFFTGKGRYSADGKPLDDVAKSPALVPSTDGRFYLSVKLPTSGGPTAKAAVGVHKADGGEELATLPDVELGSHLDTLDDVGASLERRMVFVPAAKLVIFVPPTNDKLIVRKLDVDGK
jgi:hypothetical protein